MIFSARWWRFAICLFSIAALAACTGRPDAPLSAMAEDIDVLKGRVVPANGVLLRSSKPVRTTSGVRVSWEIQTKSDAATYFRWLQVELGPEYRQTSQMDCTFSTVREAEGDSYMVGVTSHQEVGGVVVEVQFVGMPDGFIQKHSRGSEVQRFNLTWRAAVMARRKRTVSVIDTDLDSAVTHNNVVPRDVEETVFELFLRFHKKFGREPRANEPVFFDPGSNEPTPWRAEAANEMWNRLADGMVCAGEMAPDVGYAMKRTGFLVTPETQHLLTERPRGEWNAARAEYQK